MIKKLNTEFEIISDCGRYKISCEIKPDGTLTIFNHKADLKFCFMDSKLERVSEVARLFLKAVELAQLERNKYDPI